MLCFYRLSRYIIDKRNKRIDNKCIYYISQLPYYITLFLHPYLFITVIKNYPIAKVKYHLYYNEKNPHYSWLSYEYDCNLTKCGNKTITISRFAQTNIYRVVHTGNQFWKAESIKLNYDFIDKISYWYKKLIINTHDYY